MPAFLPSIEARKPWILAVAVLSWIGSVVAEHPTSPVIPSHPQPDPLKSDSTSISTLINPTRSSQPQDPVSTAFSTPVQFGSKRVPAPDVQRSINKAAASLKLIHVPLKVFCDILRRFYNSTGGVNRSNQDGWQYIDSPWRLLKAIPVPGLPGPCNVQVSSSVGSDSVADGGPDPYREVLFNPPTSLDPNNCCEWYGVVCIGLDGVIPPPWPPYDDDLVGSRVSTPRSGEVLSLRKRSTAAVPYHDFHDQNHHRYSKDSGHGQTEQATITNLMMTTTSAKVLQKTLFLTLNLKFNHLYQRTTTRDGVGQRLMIAKSLSYPGVVQQPDSTEAIVSIAFLPSTKELSRLKQLTELSLTKLRISNMNQNGFTGEIVHEIGLLKFSARTNEFKGRIPRELSNCRQLHTINLGDKHSTGDIPESLYGLQNLRILDLPDNKLSGQLSPQIDCRQA
ncbi:MAG: hypothetical protein J3Q66DRAFT_426254 [Benniella sp.]|nr:MAG: hypothetical protein J3Q66DRAFT_426254 [Benniella sp.]